MSILDMFKTAPAQPAAAVPVVPVVPVAATPGNLPAVAPDTTPVDNGVVPATSAEPVAPVENNPNSPLDNLAKLWDTPATDPNTPPAAPASLDAAKLAEIVNKADFSQNVTPETLAAITEGGDGAAVAFTQAMNDVAKQVMIQSTLASNKMIEQQVAAAVERTQASLPEMVRKQNLSNNLVDSNPVLSNPAIKPIIQAVQAQIASQNPNATPAELASLVQNTVAVMGEAMTPTSINPADPAAVNATDWGKFLNMGG